MGWRTIVLHISHSQVLAGNLLRPSNMRLKKNIVGFQGPYRVIKCSPVKVFCHSISISAFLTRCPCGNLSFIMIAGLAEEFPLNTPQVLCLVMAYTVQVYRTDYEERCTLVFSRLIKHAEQHSFLPPIMIIERNCLSKKTNIDKNYI